MVVVFSPLHPSRSAGPEVCEGWDTWPEVTSPIKSQGRVTLRISRSPGEEGASSLQWQLEILHILDADCEINHLSPLKLFSLHWKTNNHPLNL